MGQAKKELMEEQLKNSKNWITRKCIICEKPVKMNTVLDSQRADPKEPFTCPECLNK